MTLSTIQISDLKLKAIIGINDWERVKKQIIIINLSMDFDASKAAKTDNIRDTIDYKALKKEIMAFVQASQYYLLEKLAHEVLDIVMKNPLVASASVKIDKPGALRYAKSVSLQSTRKRKSIK